MEVTQFTYFQGVGGIEVDVVSGELTYGLERLAMYVQGVDNVYDLRFNNDGVTYGEVFLENERQQSEANFHGYDVDGLKRRFEDMVGEVSRFLAMTGPQGQALVLPAYDQVLKASHLFNLMDARGAIAVAERQSYIGRIRDLCKRVRSPTSNKSGRQRDQRPRHNLGGQTQRKVRSGVRHGVVFKQRAPVAVPQGRVCSTLDGHGPGGDRRGSADDRGFYCRVCARRGNPHGMG